MVNVFNVSAFFIVLRETLEACLVVGIVLAYLHRTGATTLTKPTWLGAIAGVVTSAIIGIAFTITYYVKGVAKFSGTAENLFEFVGFIIASLLLSWMILWMMKMGKSLHENIEADVHRRLQASDSKAAWAIFSLVFVQVFREGVETFIFLFGAQQSSSVSGGAVTRDAWKGILIPGLLGLIVAAFIAFTVFRGLMAFDLEKVFRISSILLMAFAAALTSRAFHELQEAGYLGLFGDDVTNDALPWWNAAMWSTEACCNDESNEFFATLNVLFGYFDSPSFVTYIAYFGYWLIFVPLVLAFSWHDIRNARNKISHHAQVLSLSLAVCFLVGFIYAVSHPTWTGILTTVFGLVLSLMVCLLTVDVFFRKVCSANAQWRRPILYICSVGLSVFAVLTSVLHVVQMACIGKSCHLPNFYYLGLIFDQDWLDAPRTATEKSYHAVAVLCVSLTLTVAVFGWISLLCYLYASNLSFDGQYIYDDMSKVEDEERAKPATLNGFEEPIDGLQT